MSNRLFNGAAEIKLWQRLHSAKFSISEYTIIIETKTVYKMLKFIELTKIKSV